jgi:hypothetical protein
LGRRKPTHGIRGTVPQDIVNEGANDGNLRAGIPYFADILISDASLGKDGHPDTFRRRFQAAQ